MKQCTKCKQYKKLENFDKRSKCTNIPRSHCKNCRAIDYLEKKEKNSPIRKAYYLKNLQKIKIYYATYYQEKAEQIRQYRKEYYQRNKSKESAKMLEYTKKYPHVKRALSAKRRAIKKQAIPKWANLNAIKQFYKNCPLGYHVDHIIPLQGEIVCGLHVENNLQYLTVEENLKKGNKY